MKNICYLLFFIFLFLFFACNNVVNEPAVIQKKKIDCRSMVDKKMVYRIADSVINTSENEDIWNLSEIDTTSFFTAEDYFTNAKTKSRLVLVDGSAGMSAGTADNLLILFDCSDSLRIVWMGQVGDFKQTDIRDLNNDGIKEIISTSEAVWMGECSRSYTIFNFKNGKRNFVYSVSSSSVIGCGYDNLGEFKQGDTLETSYDCAVLPHGSNEYMVQQIETIRVHNGGDSTEAVIDNAQLYRDTVLVKL